MKCIIYKQLQCQWPSSSQSDYVMKWYITICLHLINIEKTTHSRKFPECRCCQIYKMFSTDIMPQTMEYFTPCNNSWYYMLKDIIRVIWFFNWTVTFTPWYNRWYYMRKRHKWLILNESYMRVFEYWQSCS